VAEVRLVRMVLAMNVLARSSRSSCAGSACFAGSAFDPSPASSAASAAKTARSRQRAQRLIQRRDRRDRKGKLFALRAASSDGAPVASGRSETVSNCAFAVEGAAIYDFQGRHMTEAQALERGRASFERKEWTDSYRLLSFPFSINADLRAPRSS
jgi:hypothetical protein